MVDSVQTIKSIKDKNIILARALKSRKGRQEQKRVLLEGEEIIDWALDAHMAVDFLLVSEKHAPEYVKKYKTRLEKIFAVSEGVLKKVSATKYVIPVIGVTKKLEKIDQKPSAFTIVIDGLQDFGNIGTIIRTCQAFGIKDILSTSRDFDLFQRKTIEASRGSVFSANLDCRSDAQDTVTYLKEQGYQIVATSPRGAKLQALLDLKPQPVALVIGNETHGIDPLIADQADFLVQIPMSPRMESLNAGVAAGISIYEIKLKQVLAMIEQQIRSTLGRELSVASMLVQRALDDELRKVTDLTSRQVVFMMVLQCDQRMTVKAMCRQFGILEDEARDFLEPLLKSGWVDQSDSLSLTDSGQEMLAKLWPVVEASESRILASFTPQESGLLMDFLRRIQQAGKEIS